MNTYKHNSSVLLIIIGFFVSKSVSDLAIEVGMVSGKDYGESCSKIEKCNVWLTCDSSTETCLCANGRKWFIV
jgi:hypothetical protein